MTQETKDASLAPAAPDAGNDLRLPRLQHRHAEHAFTKSSTQPLPLLSDADKYRWICAKRGNFAIADALKNSGRDADFDAQIEAAMRMSAAGRHYYSYLDGLLR